LTTQGESTPTSSFDSTSERSLLWGPFLAIAATSFAVEVPCFFLGTPSGHDFEFHLYSWLEVLAQWKRGIVYPRWASMAHWAYGEPRFVFYPPASWTLGAALSALLPWTIISGVYIWLALVAAGISMFMLARTWLDRRDAVFAAALYAANPYHFVIVYWRSAFAELLASSLLPLLLLLVLRAAESGGRRAIVPLGAVLAASWLMNAPAAVMVHYSFALLIVVIAWLGRSPRLILRGAAAVVLGAGLASFYLVPAVYEEKWVNIAEAISPGSRPQDNFLFSTTSDRDHDAFNHLVSWVALAEILVTFVAAWLARHRRSQRRELWHVSLAWAVAIVLLMLPISGLLWNVLPKLRFMQFPWRWMLCLGVACSIFLTLAIHRWTVRLAVYMAMLLVMAFAWQRIQPPWWDGPADLREIEDNIESGSGYEGTDEYTPVGADASNVDKGARLVSVDGPAHAAIQVFEWGPESKLFTAKMSAPANLALRLFHYPAWRAEVNGQQVQATAREGTGQMLVPVGRGANRVEIKFIRTWDRTAGAWASLLTVLVLILWRVLDRRQSAGARPRNLRVRRET
jgi:6-pyruvoyl-tetrahydropterin synthase-like protein